MSDEIKKSLIDILNSINIIEEYLGSKRNFKEYEANRQLRDAIERRLEIIGEATNRILKIDSTIKIVHARRIVDLRNKVIHAYDTVNHFTIWAVIINDLPTLKAEVNELLKF
jgi:uncharacterized protein with HEPN domain